MFITATCPPILAPNAPPIIAIEPIFAIFADFICLSLISLTYPYATLYVAPANIPENNRDNIIIGKFPVSANIT